MATCDMCKKETYGRIWNTIDGKSVALCRECHDKHHYETIEANLESVEEPCHFKDWDHGDMSDAFWLHLGRYKKHPNRKSLDVMINALFWANHDSHGLSSSFHHALKWCGIDIWAENKRTDLPKV